MSQMLLLVSIGPVQQFIGRARRMRDLWFGSHLLSEMSRAAARSLADAGWILIFPALEANDMELHPCSGTRRPETDEPPLGISNKVIARRAVAGVTIPDQDVQVAREAAIGVWKRFADSACKQAGSLLATELRAHESPQAVIESFLEVVAAWSIYEADGDFDHARQEAEGAIAGRKKLRDFQQWGGGPYWKSSLDGQRETVLEPRRGRRVGERDGKYVRRLRLGPREHLDGIGLVKRAGGDPEQFVPIARIAVEPWLNAAGHHRHFSASLRALEDACKTYKVPACRPGVTDWLRGGAFLYDGEIFFEGQWPALEKELGLKMLFSDYVTPLFRRANNGLGLPEPYPYVACLCADGDRMGAALSNLRTPALQQKLSVTLADFSQSVRTIVEQHHGLHVYAGGDDVVAVLPVIQAVPCAEALRAAFIEVVHPAFADIVDDADSSPPTLSIGIAIGHFLKPLGQLLDLARAAEKYAKQGDELPDGDLRQRNALGLIIDKRSGGNITWRAQWDTGWSPGNRLQRLLDYLVERRMPAKLPYELNDVLSAMEQANDDDRAAGRAWRLEVMRIVARKRQEDGGIAQTTRKKLEPDDIDLTLPSHDEANVESVRTALRHWVGAAMIAHALADAQRNVRAVDERGIELEKHYGH